MLVRFRRALAGDGGSTLIVVLVVMLVLTTGALALAAIVTNTTVSLASSRSTVQSRGAADAGLATAVTTARKTGNFCGMSIGDSLPAGSATATYAVTSTCDTTAKTVTFVSTGKAGKGVTKTQAVYNYTSGSTGHGADMVFYGDTTFTKEVVTSSNNGLLSIVIPTGSFTCQVHVPANIIASGDIKTNGSCTIDGDVRAGGQVNMTNTTDVIKGNATGSSTSTYTLQGQILGNIAVGGAINFGWNNFTYPGNVTSTGSINLASATIAGAATLPKANTISYDGYINVNSPTATSARVKGGINWLTSVSAPAAPTFDPWFDYSYLLSDWRPFNGTTFNEVKLVNSGNGQWTCNRFMQNNPSTGNAAGWTELGTLTTPTIVDTRACGAFSANNGSNPNVALQTDIVFVANSYDLTNVTFKSKNATASKVWFITNDGVPTGSGLHVPNCSNGAGNITINGTDMSGVVAMVYTPCTIAVQGHSLWTGAFYGGAFSYGGGMTFTSGAIALPGMPGSATMPGAGASTTSAIGTLVSQRDIP
jgi:hypothetical protein